MQKIKFAIILIVILISALACKSGSSPSAPAALSGAPINTSFNAASVQQNLDAFRRQAGEADVIEMTIRPSSLEVVVATEKGIRYNFVEGKLQNFEAIGKQTEQKPPMKMSAIKVNDILVTITQRKAGGGEQLSHIHIEKGQAIGYYFSANNPLTIKTTLSGVLQ